MNPIPTENQRPGTRSWINTNASVDGNRRSTDIEGFCSKPSYRAGESAADLGQQFSALHRRVLPPGFLWRQRGALDAPTTDDSRDEA